ncbi:hypothetical protein F4778DRAFT_748155 [Xylariomycetidae sp. FL2044]|nr:hypothetical protein F4778DRAFT_748155 [Xylariomycetidae sp. FL2044]
MSIDPAAKARIVGHMNKDHAGELKQYLRAFNGLSSSAASDPAITDMTLSTLTIRSRSGVHTVAITPPLSSLADARVRLVDMAQRAQAALGISDLQVRRWTAPQPLGLSTLIGVVWFFLNYAALSAGALDAGTANADTLDRVLGFAGGAAGYRWLIRAMFWPVLLIHSVEAVWFARTRLARHGEAMGTGMRGLWMVNTFFEGYPAMRRFDGLVAEEKRKKEAAKH